MSGWPLHRLWVKFCQSNIPLARTTWCICQKKLRRPKEWMLAAGAGGVHGSGSRHAVMLPSFQIALCPIDALHPHFREARHVAPLAGRCGFPEQTHFDVEGTASGQIHSIASPPSSISTPASSASTPSSWPPLTKFCRSWDSNSSVRGLRPSVHLAPPPRSAYPLVKGF